MGNITWEVKFPEQMDAEDGSHECIGSEGNIPSMQ